MEPLDSALASLRQYAIRLEAQSERCKVPHTRERKIGQASGITQAVKYIERVLANKPTLPTCSDRR